MPDEPIFRKEFEQKLASVIATFDTKMDLITERMEKLQERYEERHQSIQLQLVQALDISKSNELQITAMVGNQNNTRQIIDKQSEALHAMEIAVAKASVMNKYLWPTVTILATIIAAFSGAALHLPI